jgi:hypothetical protein
MILLLICTVFDEMNTVMGMIKPVEDSYGHLTA